MLTHSTVGRVFGLDVLRALAILGVLSLHSSILLEDLLFSGKFLDWLLFQTGMLGFYGVELFFVLSGFLIGTILLSLAPVFKNPVVLPAFWQRRWIRTLPNYFLFLGINIGILVMGSIQLPNLLPYFVFLQNWLWVPPSFFLESWSLVVEEWFYLLFPIVIFAFHRQLKYKKAFVVSALTFLIIPTLLRVLWASSSHTNWDAEFRKIAVLRLDSIMYGVLAAYLKITFPLYWKKAKNRLLLAGVGLLSAVWFYLASVGMDTWFARTLLFSVVSLAAACLLPFCDQWHVAQENALTRSFQITALWSYSLYLCNEPMILVVRAFYVWFGQTSIPAKIVAWLAFLVLSFATSAAIYRYFEKPIMKLRERFAIRVPNPQLGTAE